MEGVSFEEVSARRTTLLPTGPDGLTGKMIMWKLARDEEGARIVLGTIAGALFALSLFVFFFVARIPEPQLPDGAVLINAHTPKQPPRLQTPMTQPK
jgi:hypothetical protein